MRDGGGGEYDRECLLNDDHNNDECNNNDKTMMQRMGRGRMGEWMTRGICYDGRNVLSGPSVGGVGQRMLIVGAAAAVDDNDDRRRDIVPPPFQSVPSHRMPLVDVVDIADLG